MAANFKAREALAALHRYLLLLAELSLTNMLA